MELVRFPAQPLICLYTANSTQAYMHHAHTTLTWKDEHSFHHRRRASLFHVIHVVPGRLNVLAKHFGVLFGGYELDLIEWAEGHSRSTWA